MKSPLEINKDKIKKYFSELDFEKSVSVKIVITFITALLIFLMLPGSQEFDTNYEIGSIWTKEDLIAPFSFPIYKDEKEYEQEKEEVQENIALIFTVTDQNKNIADSIRNFRNTLRGILEKAVNLEKNNEGYINTETLDADKERLKITFTDKEWEELFALYKNSAGMPVSYNNFISLIEREITGLASNSIINIDKSRITSGRISLKREDEKLQDVIDAENILDKQEALGIFSSRIVNELKPAQAGVDSVLAGAALKIADRFLQTDLIYDNEFTQIEIANRIEQIPRTIGIVRENERIISKHDPINRFTKLKLDSYRKIRLERVGVQDVFLQNLGKLSTITILFLIIGLFLFYIRRRLFEDNIKLIIISSLIIIVSFISYISLTVDIDAPLELFIFVSVASILLTIIFDSRVAFFITAILCFLIAAVRGGDYSIAFISFCASVLAIFSVRDMRQRSQIFRSFFFILVGYILSILALNLGRVEENQRLLTELLFGTLNAVMSPVIAYGLLIFYERVFKITTDLTLLELSDFNHPLLKELSSKAPGTFHHSIVMGNLSEAAAEATGANQILTRVGCYYHDIGKTLRPQYFIENQLDRTNKHEKLNPNISTKIIKAHVKDGIELAKKYNLPQEIINFIPMHHGTTLVSYFYDKAKKSGVEMKTFADDYIYRYTGPKPQTKETGIVMLADAIEASTRAIEDPSPQKLEEKIDEISKARFMEGELEECDLTLRDLTKIKKSFLKVLLGIHHHRIKYPETAQPEILPAKKETKLT
jgi:putative nucleotidyltransferase with HDIG domain